MNETPAIENTSKRDAGTHFVGLLVDGNDAYIGGMEKDGQRQLVASSLLPTDIRDDRADYEELGFVFGSVVEGDPLFQHVTLPEGWSKRPTDHDMWSSVVDADGNERVSVFYKAAFYDRVAFMRIVGG